MSQGFQLVFVVIVIQQGFMALVWVLLARLRLARSASWHWCATSVLTALGIGAVLARPWLPPDWPVAVAWALPNILALAAFVMVHRGLVRFARLPSRDREHAATLGLGAAVIAVLPALDPGGRVWLSVATAITMLPIVRSAWTIRHGLAEEFGLVAVRCVAAAVLLLAGFFAFRTIATLVIGVPVLIERGGASNVVVALAYLTLGLVLNFTLGALVVMRLVFRLRHLSHHDPLTQLLNRRGLERALGQERQRQRRHSRPMALLALDLDHFKSINDRHGHGAGDQVLVQVAALLRAQCRGGDLAARTGGEEFVMLLPDTDLAGARQAAERLLQTLREHALTAGGERLSVTASIGVAVTEDPREELIGLWRRLDRALYRAKDQGRDRAVLAEGLSPSP